jgi:hypothetical protein
MRLWLCRFTLICVRYTMDLYFSTFFDDLAMRSKDVLSSDQEHCVEPPP